MGRARVWYGCGFQWLNRTLAQHTGGRGAGMARAWRGPQAFLGLDDAGMARAWHGRPVAPGAVCYAGRQWRSACGPARSQG
eukprot:gene25301-biopygen5998